MPLVEGHFERGVVRLQQDIGDDDLVFELGVLAFVAGVLMGADVLPGPAVEAAVLDVGDVVGNEVVAEGVALVDGTPELAGVGIDGEADGVANA